MRNDKDSIVLPHDFEDDPDYPGYCWYCGRPKDKHED